MDTQSSLIIPDCHHPFCDIRAYDLMLSVAKDIPELREVVILGDFADFYGINAHGKDPSIRAELHEERRIVCKKLYQLKKMFPDARKVYIEGNHEYRLARYIQNKAPELFGITDTKDLLALDLYEFEFVPYGPYQKYNVLGTDLIARHEPLGGGLHCAHGTITKASCSVIFGHTHRIQESQIVSIDGNTYRGISSGWLGDKEHSVMNYVKNHHQWSLGFTVINKIDDIWIHNLIHIIKHNDTYRCIYNGYYYEN